MSKSEEEQIAEARESGLVRGMKIIIDYENKLESLTQQLNEEKQKNNGVVINSDEDLEFQFTQKTGKLSVDSHFTDEYVNWLEDLVLELQKILTNDTYRVLPLEEILKEGDLVVYNDSLIPNKHVGVKHEDINYTYLRPIKKEM